MRGADTKQATMLTLMSPEKRVPATHPLRKVKALAEDALRKLSPAFDGMYAEIGRPSIPPERLLKATLLMAFYTVRSERLFCEQLDYNLLFRWFLDMDTVEDGFDHSSFTRNRERLLKHDVARQFFAAIVEQARAAKLMSDDHFTVDGTLIEAWASHKSFRPKGEHNGPPSGGGSNPTADFHGQKRRNETHASTTDPEAKLARKGDGKEAKLAFSQHALMENRNGLLVDVRIADANSKNERLMSVVLLAQHVREGATVAGDKGYDTADFVGSCRALGITPHVAQAITTQRGSRIDRRTTRHPGYATSQRVRKRVEEIFGWMKTVGHFRRTRLKGIGRTQVASYLVGAAYNLLRIAKLREAPA